MTTAVHASSATASRLRPSLPLAMLSLFLCITFATGGSSWPAEPGLAGLRLCAVAACVVGAWTLRADDVRGFRALWLLVLTVIALPLFQLVPLPFAWWSHLPGRETVVAVDAAMGLGPIARPVSMQPVATLNALAALAIPLAVVMLAVQLNAHEHRIVLWLLIGLVLCNAGLAVAQAAGSTIALYDESTDTPGLFANRNHSAALLAMLFPLVAAGLQTVRWRGPDSPWRFVILAATIGLIIPLLLVVGSRSGLALCVIAFVLTPLTGLTAGPTRRTGTGKMGGKRHHVAILAGACLAIGLILLATAMSRDLALLRMVRMDEDLRWPLWRSVIEATPQFMPFGAGIGSFAQAYQIIEPDALLRPDFANHAHNDWIELVFVGGLPAVALVLWAVLFFSRATLAALRARPQDAVLSRLGIVMLVVLALASMTDYPVRTPILFAVLALAAVWASPRRAFHVTVQGPQCPHSNI